MTIQMLRQFNGLNSDQVYTLSGAEEARLVNAGLARFFDLNTDSKSPGDIPLIVLSAEELATPSPAILARRRVIYENGNSWFRSNGTALLELLSSNPTPGNSVYENDVYESGVFA